MKEILRAGIGVGLMAGVLTIGNAEHHGHPPAFEDRSKVDDCAGQLGSHAVQQAALSSACAPFRAAFPYKGTAVNVYKPYQDALYAKENTPGDTTSAYGKVTYSAFSPSDFRQSVKVASAEWHKDNSLPIGLILLLELGGAVAGIKAPDIWRNSFKSKSPTSKSAAEQETTPSAQA